MTGRVRSLDSSSGICGAKYVTDTDNFRKTLFYPANVHVINAPNWSSHLQMTDIGPVRSTETLKQSCCEARGKRKWPTTGNQGQHRIINLLEEV
jgi:hypothetical protein